MQFDTGICTNYHIALSILVYLIFYITIYKYIFQYSTLLADKSYFKIYFLYIQLIKNYFYKKFILGTLLATL